MAIQTIDIKDIDLKAGLHAETGYRIIALADTGAHKFGANLYIGSTPLSASELQSTAYGYFVRSDGVTVELYSDIETVSGVTCASVILNQQCYCVPGRFTLAIKVYGAEGNILTVRLLEGYVYPVRSDRTIEAGVGTSISDVLAALDERMNKPSIAGTAGQVLVSDGQGNVSWQSVEATQVSGSVRLWQNSTTYGSPLKLRTGTDGEAGYITFVLED